MPVHMSPAVGLAEKPMRCWPALRKPALATWTTWRGEPSEYGDEGVDPYWA